jgi:lysophospholipase L1-like esterase
MCRTTSSILCIVGLALPITGHLVLATSTSAAQGEKGAKTSFKFVFGPGKTAPGFLRVTPTTAYTKELGYGLDFGFKVEGVESGGDDVVQGSFVTSSKPFYFSVDVPEGNYDVTVTLGDAQGESTTSVLAETRRPAIIGLVTEKGKFATRTFTANVHNSFQRNGKQIGLTDRERTGGPNGGMFLHLDGDKLTLQFADKRPCVCAVEIVKNDTAPTLFLCGDSTVTDQPKGEFCSWGQTLPLFFKPKLAAVANHAESGRTSSGFLGERRLDKIADLMKPGDYLFVHFAHNDSHSPGGVALLAYKKNLEKFIDTAHKKGATPILVTTMNRLGFDANGKAKADLAAYAQAMREVAKDKKEFLVDLNKMSIEFYETLGPEKGKLAFKSGDKTHSAFYGAYEFARFIAESVQHSDLPLAKLVVDDLPARNFNGPVLKVPGF